MLSRRDFLKSLLSTVATTVLIKRSIIQPEQIIGVDWAAEGASRSVATVFDMAANTWREQSELPSMLFGYPVREWVAGPAFDSPIMTAPLGRLNCRCVLSETDDLGGYLIPPEHLKGVRQFLKDGGVARGHSIVVPFEDTTLEEVARLRGVNMPDYSNNPFPKLDNFGISCDVAAKRIQAFCQAVLDDDARRTINGIPS